MTIAHAAQPNYAGPTRIRLPRPKADIILVCSLYVCIAAFYLANIYQYGLHALFTVAKWPVLALVVVTAFVGLARARKVRPGSYFIAFLFLAVLASNLIGAVDVGASAAAYATVVLSMVAARLVAANFDHIALRKRFFDIFYVIGAVVVVASAAMYALGLNLGRTNTIRFSGWSDNPNTLAAILAPGLLVMIAGVIARRPQWQWRYALPLLPGLFILYQTGSRAALLWILASSVAFWIYRRGVSFGALMAGVGLVLFFGWREPIIDWAVRTFSREGMRANATVDALVSGRAEVWDLGLVLAHDRPVLGYGFGSSEPIITDYDWFFTIHQGAHFHNSYLTALVEGGLVALVALCVMLIVALALGLREASLMRNLPRQEWPFVALPWVILVGALVHAFFETWLLSAGNANLLLLWACIWMLHETSARRPAARQPHRPQSHQPRRPRQHVAAP